jgi:integrase
LVNYTIQVQSDLGFGLSLLLGFRGLLRVGEICGLQKCKVIFSADLATAVLELGLTKGGQRRGVEERITLDDPFLVRLFFLHLEEKLPGDFAFKASSNQFRAKLAALLRLFNLGGLNYKTHSLRRGGATHLFRVSGSYDKVMELGRWANQKTCRIYVAEAVASLSSILRAPSAKLMIAQQAKLFKKLSSL